MEYHIRPAEGADIAMIHRLVSQLAEYERAADQVITTTADYQRDFEAGRFQALVAVDLQSGEIVGMALYYFAYSTWKGRYLWLEDFIVTEQCRGKGVGRLLFDAVGAIAAKENTFMKWQVLDWNTPAINFYNKYPMEVQDEWLTCRMPVRS
ncbi:MAG TPA: GNAT family N-acetyltransferase [Chitinophagales bacterium]|nr:GNAT family N-acetyltransferase [Chitinophagales bacterium]HNK99078.1 GNAT family N-acetyltransferase [Chitinophagales bacterium]